MAGFGEMTQIFLQSFLGTVTCALILVLIIEWMKGN